MTRKETLMEQVQQVEDILKDSLHRVNVIEKKLNAKLITIENRERLEKELEDVKIVLKSNEQRLKNLRKENTKSFMIASCLVFFCFLFYGIYEMLNNY